ncbi:unnamed protein product [Peniophora sp. CBMAI 1063]|nr:unnamed protein product [Peniophora sp. CBMAI 1063]
MLRPPQHSSVALRKRYSLISSTEEVQSFQRTKKRVSEATASIAGAAVTIGHDALATGVDLLQLAPIPALSMAGSILLNIWEAVELIEINRVAYLRLTERCAETLISVRREVQLAGPNPALELADPLRALLSAFNGVYSSLLKQTRRTFLQRYLKRTEDQREISDCDTSLNAALQMFSLQVQIRTLKLVQESESRRQEDNRMLASLSAASSRSAFEVSGEETMLDSAKVHILLSSYRRDQNIRDRRADLADLRMLLRTALQQRSDLAMIEVLQIGRDEMPEAISTLQRALHVGVTTPNQYTQSILTVSADGDMEQRSEGRVLTAREDLGTSHGLDDFDREFITTGIAALTRLSQGADLSVPSWTITRHEIDLEKKIGIGFFSDVYKGRCRGRTVAIKVLADTTPRSLFVREVNIWIQLRHQNVIELLGASSATSDPPWFLVSRYYRHGNLAHYLHDRKTSQTDHLKMMHEIAQGMSYLHSKDVLHGDLKASNILVDDSLCCIIADFGQSEMRSEVFRLSASPPSRGTVRWQAPEVIMGAVASLTPGADVYAFGILCAEIVNQGAIPWPLADDNIIRHLVCVENKRPDLPPSFDHHAARIIQMAWERDPQMRPPFEDIARRIDSFRGIFDFKSSGIMKRVLRHPPSTFALTARLASAINHVSAGSLFKSEKRPATHQVRSDIRNEANACAGQYYAVKPPVDIEKSKFRVA